MTVHKFHRHGQPGYYSLADLPQRPSIEQSTLSTGWWEFDQIWKPYPGQFTVVTGIAGHGKSTFLLNIVCNLAKAHGTRSFLYVPENEAHVVNKLKRIWGNAPDFERFCAEQCFIQSAEQGAYDSEPHTLPWVLDKAVVAVERDGVDILLLDPWNEIERAKPKDMLLTDYIGQCLMWLKQFTRCFDVAVIVVAHPTKSSVTEGGKSRAPGLVDIEGSMNWYNKCDNGLIVSRDLTKNETKVISAKVRETGAGKIGCCFFTVDEMTGIFTPQHGAVT